MSESQEEAEELKKSQSVGNTLWLVNPSTSASSFNSLVFTNVLIASDAVINMTPSLSHRCYQTPVVTSAKQHQNPCSGPLTDSANYWECILISFQPGWQIIDNVILPDPATQVGAPEQGFCHCLILQMDLTRVTYCLWRGLMSPCTHHDFLF